MDIRGLVNKIPEAVKKHRYPLLVLLIGLALMCIPGTVKNEENSAPVASSAQTGVDVGAQLAEILAQIDGVGKVRVMLTVSAGQSVIYQTDDDITDTSVRKDTVIISDSNRNEQALIVQVLPEAYRGAIIVCQGGDKASVKLAVMEAVSKATGLDPECISVLKMK